MQWKRPSSCECNIFYHPNSNPQVSTFWCHPRKQLSMADRPCMCISLHSVILFSVCICPKKLVQKNFIYFVAFSSEHWFTVEIFCFASYFTCGHENNLSKLLWWQNDTASRPLMSRLQAFQRFKAGTKQICLILLWKSMKPFDRKWAYSTISSFSSYMQHKGWWVKDLVVFFLIVC